MAKPGTTEMPFGELVLTFTTNFELKWNDRKSGARQDVSFYHPIPPEGFYPLASIGIPSAYENPNGLEASICVKESPPGEWDKPPLSPPICYDFIWNDAHSGATLFGSCWRPIPPPGYVALGDVFQAGYEEPSTDIIRCVAIELTTEAMFSEAIWLDRGAGRKVPNFGAWEIIASTPILDAPDGVFAVNSFVGIANRDAYKEPTSSAVGYNLRLPLPTIVLEEPARPFLTSRVRPPGETNPTVDRIVTVPFTSVRDDDKDLAWKVDNSPFYNVERVVDYRLIIFIDNTSNTDQTASTAITTGISREQSETFSHSTGITISSGAGIEAGVFSANASVSMTYSFGYSSTSASTQFREETDTVELTASARTAAAVWTQSTNFRSKRGDGEQVGQALAFDPTDTSYAFDHFPTPANCKARGATISTWRHRLTAARIGDRK